MGEIKHIHNLLETKQISCVELTKNYLKNIEEKNNVLNAYVNVTKEEALKKAESVDRKIASGEELMILDGIPMSLKDNISTKGIETTCCSKMLKGYYPIYDATVWEILKKHTILLGKTNMDEFAMGSTCETSYFGGALNPHNTDYVTGGSSGGAAASVAAGLAVFGLGSDTGGSIRQPASFCGVVGFKPTYGTVSRYGVVSYASSLDQVGPITNSVEDASIVYDSIFMHDPKDATSLGGKISTYDKLNSSIKGLKIGIAEEFFDGLKDDVRKPIEKTIKVYEELGAEIVPIKMPWIKETLPAYMIISCGEASSNFGRYDGIRYGYKTNSYTDIDTMICKTRSEGFGKEVKKRLMFGTYVLSAGHYEMYFKKAQGLRGLIISNFESVFEKCTVILTPAAQTTAFEKGAFKNSVDAYGMDVTTIPANIAGLPAISVPCGVDRNNMPVGMQIMGNKFEDYKVLNAAFQYEKNTKNGRPKETTCDWCDKPVETSPWSCDKPKETSPCATKSSQPKETSPWEEV